MTSPPSTTSTAPPVTEERPAWAVDRLPATVRPSHYDLTLHPHLQEGVFSGNVSITIAVSEPTSRLLFNAHNLKVASAQVNRPDGSAVTVHKHFVYEKSELLVVETETLKAGEYVIHFEYSGSLVEDIVGFYRSSYVDPQTKERRYLATSKFEPTYARRAFPCYDEPNFKTTYTIQLIHDKDYHGLSNMDVKSVSPWSGNEQLLITKFNTSVLISTYLVAFTVSDFKSTTTKTKDGKPFSSYSRPSEVDNTKYATDFGAKVQDFYEEYFQVPYALPKQDLIAVPDFPSGAMENWGLISFREVALLQDNNRSSLTTLIAVSKTIAHELTHQWFGNIVTMDWWDDLWLNEGFATFMSYKGMKQFHPDWDTDAFFQSSEMKSALSLDSMASSHPIVPKNISHPDQITAAFDTISYAKGSSVLWMLEDFMTEELFQKGLQKYLKLFQFKNAKTEDLWKCLSDATDKKLDIKSIMSTWTEQQGFPMISVTSSNKEGSLVVRQEHFLKSKGRTTLPKSIYDYKWDIPLSYLTETKKSGLHWLRRENELTLHIPDWNSSQWIKLNWKQKGFYRVNYDDSMWKRFSVLLMDNHQDLSIVDRSGLLDDAFTLASAGKLSYTTAFSLTQYLSKEKDYLPWATILDHFGELSSLLANTEAFPVFREYVMKIIEPIYDDLKWSSQNENIMNSLLQRNILSFLCQVGSDECLFTANQMLQQWLNNTEAIDSNLLSIVLKYGVVTATPKTWDSLWSQYMTTSSPELKRNILRGLANTPYVWQLYRLLGLASDEHKISRQDYFIVLGFISNNPVGLPIVWDFIRNNWEQLVTRFSLNNRYMGNCVKQVASQFTTKPVLLEIEEFFQKYPEGGAGNAGRRTAIDTVYSNIEWLSNNQNTVLQWLQQQVS